MHAFTHTCMHTHIHTCIPIMPMVRYSQPPKNCTSINNRDEACNDTWKRIEKYTEYGNNILKHMTVTLALRIGGGMIGGGSDEW